MTDLRESTGNGSVTGAGNGELRPGEGGTRPAAAPGRDQIMIEGGSEWANRELVNHMNGILRDARDEAVELRRKLKWTYWLVVTLSTLLFLVGLALVSMPAWSPLAGGGQPDLGVILAGVGIGFVDFVGLFLFNPLARVQKLMGDISQMTALFSAYQIRVALHLVETDSDRRETMGAASGHVAAVTVETLELIESYYEKWLLSDLKQPESA